MRGSPDTVGRRHWSIMLRTAVAAVALVGLGSCVASGRAIFTETPIDLELARIDAINSAVAERGVPMMVGFQRRYDPDFALPAGMHIGQNEWARPGR